MQVDPAKMALFKRGDVSQNVFDTFQTLQDVSTQGNSLSSALDT